MPLPPKTPPAVHASDRLQSLDILRAIAITLVLGRHLRVNGSADILNGFADGWRTGGWTGVDLFFVLSGFLISGLLFKDRIRNGVISFKRFFIRRGFKIYPAFYFMVLDTLFSRWIYHQAPSLKKLAAEFFFYQDYVPGVCSQTWSLGVEEKFYVFLPVLLILLLRFEKKKKQPFESIPAAFIFIAFACLVFRFLASRVQPFDYWTHLFPFHLRVDSLFFGVLISYFYHFRSGEFQKFVAAFKYVLPAAGLALFIPAFLFPVEKTPLSRSSAWQDFIWAAGSS